MDIILSNLKMLSVKIFLIFSILLSVVLAFFSVMLLAALATDSKNFLFTKIIFNKANNNTLLQSGTGLIAGTSIGLIVSLSLFYHNYNCGFGNYCNSAEKEKPKIYHEYGEEMGQQGKISKDSSPYGKAIEWVNGALIIFLAVGLTMFSIEFFKLIEDDGFNNNDELMLWIIFGLSLAIILIMSCLLIFVLIVKKPKTIKEGETGASVSTFYTPEEQKLINFGKERLGYNITKTQKPKENIEDTFEREITNNEMKQPYYRNSRDPDKSKNLSDEVRNAITQIKYS